MVKVPKGTLGQKKEDTAFLWVFRAGILRAQHQGFSRVAEAAVPTQQAPGYIASFLLLHINANLSRCLTYAVPVEGAGNKCGWRRLAAE